MNFLYNVARDASDKDRSRCQSFLICRVSGEGEMMNPLAYTAGLTVLLARFLSAGHALAFDTGHGEQDPQTPPKQEERDRTLVDSPVAAANTWTPMTDGQKLRLGVVRTLDPIAFGGTALKAGVYQWLDPDSEYGKGVPGYAKRVAISFTDGATSKMLSTFVFPALLHQDPRYFPRGTGSFGGRLGYALSRVVRTRNDAGGRAFNWSRILGSLGSGALSNTYYPVEDRGAALTFANAGWSTLSEAGVNIFREFWPNVRKWRARHHASKP